MLAGFSAYTIRRVSGCKTIAENRGLPQRGCEPRGEHGAGNTPFACQRITRGLNRKRGVEIQLNNAVLPFRKISSPFLIDMSFKALKKARFTLPLETVFVETAG